MRGPNVMFATYIYFFYAGLLCGWVEWGFILFPGGNNFEVLLVDVPTIKRQKKKVGGSRLFELLTFFLLAI